MNTSRFMPWLLRSACALAVTACTCKEDRVTPAPERPTTVVNVSYDQTYCSDRWSPGQALSVQQLPAAAAAYLAQQGIRLSQPTATKKNQEAVCNACSCTTGVVLEGTVSAADLPAVLALGFKH